MCQAEGGGGLQGGEVEIWAGSFMGWVGRNACTHFLMFHSQSYFVSCARAHPPALAHPGPGKHPDPCLVPNPFAESPPPSPPSSSTPAETHRQQREREEARRTKAEREAADRPLLVLPWWPWWGEDCVDAIFPLPQLTSGLEFRDAQWVKFGGGSIRGRVNFMKGLSSWGPNQEPDPDPYG